MLRKSEPMKKRMRRLGLHSQTLRVLGDRELAAPAGGVPNYNTSIDHKGCSSVTVYVGGCWTNGASQCGPCDPAS